jgi:hypothetical protein
VAARFFTPDEANELLVAVRPLVERMVEHRRALGQVAAQRSRINTLVAANGGGLRPQAVAQLDAKVKAAARGVQSCVEAIEELGAVVKDAERGLVDFPALRGDEEVLLCWQLGEDEIGYWHGLEDGFAGRRELPF